MCSCNLTVYVSKDGVISNLMEADIFTLLGVNYHPDLKVPCVNVTADNFIVTKKKKTSLLTKIFSPLSLFCSIQSITT